ncbi:hypothetical protein VTJ83DRAFT_1938 [Remersonia thermophila]|uniref:C2H2-type domain-containing protein n=1 Tax=Remersonia thermophila TaxID=72144 RepID=A0ABR4DHH9_9PEZI
MHDAGPFTAAIHSESHSYGSHPVQPLQHPAAVTNHHHQTHHVPCPYEDKVTKDGTTARMVLLFLRELLDQLTLGEQPVQQSYGCPMTRCHQTFAAPLHVVHHLLSCPELPSGEFNCDKCGTSHSFPTNEKDWAQWSGWKCPPSAHPGPDIQRKRSLGSKMKDFAFRKKDPARKQNPVASDSPFKSTASTATRPSTSASEAPSSLFASRGFQNALGFPGHTDQGTTPGYLDFQKPVLSHGLPDVDASMFWPNFDGTASDLPSTVSSVAQASTIGDSPSERLSQHTSQSTLFGTGLGAYQTPTTSGQDHGALSGSQQYVYSPRAPFNGGMTGLPSGPAAASTMCLDDPVSLVQSPVSPADMSTGANGSAWWSGKVEGDTPHPTPSSTGPEVCFPIQAGMMSNMTGVVNGGIPSPTSPTTAGSPYYSVQPAPSQSMTRALSQESMQSSSIATVFGSPATEVPQTSGLGALSPPPASNSQATAAAPSKPAADSSVEELVCDECQWKPRGVRENLKGYLRKHKNTHKGVRLACDVPNCVKTFSRLDNLKKHKKDKHGIDESGSTCAKRTTGDYVETAREGSEAKRPAMRMTEADLRSVATDDYSMLWPALHF